MWYGFFFTLCVNYVFYIMWKYLELSFSKSERPYCYLLTIGLFYIHEFMHYNTNGNLYTCVEI